MRRSVAIIWHALSFVLAAALFFFFVLPRWPELAGDVPHTLGTVLRIATGVTVGLTALPVLFTLRRTRRPEFGTPQLALNLRAWSVAGYLLAGSMIAGTAVAEIWIGLDAAGPWLFGIYGAAAAIAVLSALAFLLAYAAELPPAPPKPLRPKKSAPEAVETADAGESSGPDTEQDAESPGPEPDETADTDATGTDSSGEADRTEPGPTPRGLRNKRPTDPARSGAVLSE